MGSWIFQLPFACSGPGAPFAIWNSRTIGTFSLWVCGVLLAGMALSLLAKRRTSLALGTAAALMVMHPAWFDSAIGGDCGYSLRWGSCLWISLFAGLACYQWFFARRPVMAKSFLERLAPPAIDGSGGWKALPNSPGSLGTGEAATRAAEATTASSPAQRAMVDHVAGPLAPSWDEAPRTADVPWYPDANAKPRKRRFQWAISWRGMGASLLLSVLMLPASVAFTENVVAYHKYTNAYYIHGNLRSLATAQLQYTRKHPGYATSARQLYDHGNLIGLNWAEAFEQSQGNGDSVALKPWTGYVYRVLTPARDDPQMTPVSANAVGVNALPVATLDDPDGPTAPTFAFVARTTQVGATDHLQFYLGEDGAVYQHEEPRPGDINFGQFLCDHLCSPEELKAQGWVPIR